ncbi:superoxide dismutase [Halopelagius longus]|uniref:Superoxide dismutase n=1 Tax=Halopelagius longus TaxID=1236180 RepID=A0A1H1ECL1_9EURY|nr:superoxide dismutase [Halopelagius longus]RDI71700.1 superoxide dismutase [Halopelagius longus]SDQ86492.1 superoxide dismutase, Fe-Mn family [Halopelagius longus]
MTDGSHLRSESLPELERRTVLRGVGVAAGATLLGTDVAAATGDDDGDGPAYRLPPLPYDYDALEPHIDERTMTLHHDTHHQGYVDGANEALQTLAEMREADEFDGVRHVKRDLSFNLSGHILHTIFWENMSPDGGGTPSGALADRIETDFGSFAAMCKEFSASASNVEGSGWGTLLYDHRSDSLLVTQVENHDELVVQGGTPLLVLDVWEHAYYLQYENNRSEYVDAFWNVVDWANVEKRYESARDANLLDDD